MAKKLPPVNPYAAPFAFCSVRGCGKLMKPTLQLKGGEPTIRYTCESCEYYCETSPSYLNGQCRTVGVEKSPPEVFAK